MNVEIVKKQISELKDFLSLPSVDVCWTKYDSADEVINELELIEAGILNQDNNAINQLRFLLSPTSALQEISISSGWGDEFISIAKIIENALDK